jgi:hypothetical protein
VGDRPHTEHPDELDVPAASDGSGNGGGAAPRGRPDERRHEHHSRLEEIAEELTHAVYEAERETGVHEETVEEVRRSLALRAVRTVAGFVLIGVGASLIVLPGPGWLVVLMGLSLLPFAWAERTIRAIRRRVPGIPEDGTIPARTWVVIGVVTVGAIVGSFLFGEQIGRWIGDAWASFWD